MSPIRNFDEVARRRTVCERRVPRDRDRDPAPARAAPRSRSLRRRPFNVTMATMGRLAGSLLLGLLSTASGAGLAPLVLSNTPPQYRQRARRLLQSPAAAATPAASGPLFRPIDFGADPEGQVDSAKAFDGAVAAMLARDGSRELASGNHDLGGATLDLGGGVYLISKPVYIPMLHANFRITGGTLRASASFPKDRYMIEIGECMCPTAAASRCH